MPAASRKNDLEVLAPKPVELVIGGRAYTQEPLTLRATANLIVAISDAVEKATTSPALAALMDTDIANMDAVAMVPMLMNLFKGIPDSLPRIVALILTGHEDEDDMDHIDKTLRPGQFLRIIRTFVEQNEPEELIENFMVLRSTLGEAWSKAKATADQM